MDAIAAELGHEVLAWRAVPTDNRSLGASAVKVEPVVEQWFVAARGAKNRHLDAEAQVRGSGLEGRGAPPARRLRTAAQPPAPAPAQRLAWVCVILAAAGHWR